MRGLSGYLITACLLASFDLPAMFGAPFPPAASEARARSFLKTVRALSPKANVREADLRPTSGREAKYWRETIAFSTSDDKRVEVDSTSGTICYYYDHGLTAQSLLRNRPAGTAIAREAAIARARAVLRAAGALAEVGQPVLIESQADQPATFAGHTWIVTFPRTQSGVPYRNQQATVILLAETGQLVGMGLAFTTPPAVTEPYKVGPEAARRIAEQALTRQGLEAGTLIRLIKQIVVPNDSWIAKKRAAERSTGNRPVAVWNAVFRNGNRIHEVWVHGATGAVLGGETSFFAGGGSRVSPGRR